MLNSDLHTRTPVMTSTRIGALALMLSMLVPTLASAQRGTLDRYRASETTEDDFHLSRPGDFGDMRLGAQLHLDYGLDPLVYEAVLGDASSETASIVEHQLTGTVGAAFGIGDRYVVFAGLPVVFLLNGASDAELTGFGVPSASGAGLGDVYLGGRVRILGESEDDYVLGAQLTATLPTSGGDEYRGDKFLSVHPELLGELRIAGDLRIVLNLGALIREETESSVSNLEYGHELTYGVGVAVPVWVDQATSNTHVDLHAQIYGATAFSLFGDREGTALEATVGGKFFHETGVVAGLAIGPGLARGFGSPDLRVVATVGWAMPEETGPRDSDGDGLFDDVDECPDDPEDADSFEDEDGCPDPDNDADGILDGPDECPDQPETVNELDDSDGCPDEVGDRDGDGLLDHVDECPDDAEDADEFEDEDGCPDPDNDSDTVLDGPDECPNEAGPVDNRGCPDTDRDQDTVVDRRDNCPDEPGPVENQGCAVEQRVVLGAGGLEILDRVHFRTNRARIQRRSHALLLNVASVLNAHPEIRTIRVEGHTDSRGRRATNLELSQQRAQAVVDFLVTRGEVEAGRLVAQGFGPDRPIVEGASSREDHAANRRVEFNVPTDGAIEQRDSGPEADTID